MTHTTEKMLVSSQKRKLVSEYENHCEAERNKIFKDAGEYFDQISNTTSEPAKDVIVDKEVIKTTDVHAVKKEVNDVDAVIEAEVNDIVGEIEYILDNLLVVNNSESNDHVHDKTKEYLSKVKSIIYDSLDKKSKEIETLKSDNILLSNAFAAKIAEYNEKKIFATRSR